MSGGQSTNTPHELAALYTNSFAHILSHDFLCCLPTIPATWNEGGLCITDGNWELWKLLNRQLVKIKQGIKKLHRKGNTENLSDTEA